MRIEFQADANVNPAIGRGIVRLSPGVILIPSSVSVGEAIERLLIVWLTCAAQDIENQIWWLPG